MNIETGFLYTSNETREMNVGAVCTASQNPKIVSTRPTEATGSHDTCATSSGGVEWSRHTKRGAMFHDIFIEKHRPRKKHWKCCRDRIYQRVGSKTFSFDSLSSVTNFACENSGQCKRLEPSGAVHL